MEGGVTLKVWFEVYAVSGIRDNEGRWKVWLEVCAVKEGIIRKSGTYFFTAKKNHSLSYLVI